MLVLGLVLARRCPEANDGVRLGRKSALRQFDNDRQNVELVSG